MKKLLGLTSFLLILNACGGGNPFGKSDLDPTGGGQTEENLPAPAPGDQSAGSPEDPSTNEPAGPNFQVIRSQVLQPKCVRCHSGAGSGGVNLETYDSVLRNLSRVGAVVVEGSMPPRGPIEKSLQDLLLKWIQLGAPQ